MSKPYSGYVRISQVAGRSGVAFQSPDQQREAIERWATFKGVEIDDPEIDLDRSGATLRREGLEAILERIERGESAGIVVSKLDRLSRSVVGGLSVIERIEAAGGQVVSCDGDIDTSNPNGRFQLQLMLAVSEWYRACAKEAWAVAQERAIDRGALPGRNPYGTRRLEDGTVELDDEQAAVVLRMVTLRGAGKGWKAIATQLSKDGLQTPTGGSQWAASTVQSIVSSEAPLGVWVGPRDTRVEDAWTPMVARSVWDSAQLVRGKRDDARAYQDRLLAGIARCASCRRTMKRTTNQQGHVSYGCTNRACPSRSSIGAVVLDTYISGLLDERLSNLTFEAGHASDDTYDALRMAQDASQSELERWRDDAEMRGIIGDDDYRAGLVIRALARDETAAALSDYQRSMRTGISVDLPSDRVVTLDELSGERQRMVVDAYLHAVMVRKSLRRGPLAGRDVADRVKVCWSDDRDLPQLPGPTTGDLTPVNW